MLVNFQMTMNIVSLRCLTTFRDCDSETKGSNLPQLRRLTHSLTDLLLPRTPSSLRLHSPAWRLAQVESGRGLLTAWPAGRPVETFLTVAAEREKERERERGPRAVKEAMLGWKVDGVGFARAPTANLFRG